MYLQVVMFIWTYWITDYWITGNGSSAYCERRFLSFCGAVASNGNDLQPLRFVLLSSCAHLQALASQFGALASNTLEMTSNRVMFLVFFVHATNLLVLASNP